MDVAAAELRGQSRIAAAAALATLSPSASVSLHRVDRVSAPTAVVVYFECEDLDARVEALEAAGVTFEAKPADQPWLWREAYLADPDGNVLCLFRAGIHRKNPPWRVP
jgi:uncharacterized glyoxalase superfamily protein PhnB